MPTVSSTAAAPVALRRATAADLGPEIRDWLLLGFALVGLGLSVGAILMQQGMALIGCTLLTLDACMAVLLPVFANHFGIPIAWLGVGGYGAILALSTAVVLRRPRHVGDEPAVARWRSLLGVRRWLILGAFGFSVYFMWFQGLFIGQFCPICLSSAATSSALLLIELTRPNVATLAQRRGVWWPRRPSLLAVCSIAVAVSAGTVALAQAWHPLAEYERTKNELFAQFERATAEPLIAAGAEKPTLVLGSKEGCPLCVQYFGREMADPRVRPLLTRYRVLIAEVPNDAGALNRLHIKQTPALAVVGAGGETRRMLGLRPVEHIVMFLEGRPVPEG